MVSYRLLSQPASRAQIGREVLEFRFHRAQRRRLSFWHRSLCAQESLQYAHDSAGSIVTRDEMAVGGLQVLQRQLAWRSDLTGAQPPHR
jgi:hypothetical protein